MPNLEERVQALEREITERKHSEEMLTIAIRALVSKEAFEKLQETIEGFQEQNGKLFNVIINQNALHNERLGDFQGQLINHDNKFAELTSKATELDGKVVGLQTEMRQHFTEQDGKIAGLQTEMRQRFTEQDSKFTGLQTALQQILTRLPEKP